MVHWKRMVAILFLIFYESLAEGTLSAGFLTTEVSARAVGMGGAFAAAKNDLALLYSNPAGIFTFDSTQVSFAHTSHFENTSYQWLAAGTPLSEDDAVGGSIVYQGDSNFVQNDEGNDIGTLDIYNVTVSAGYGRCIAKNVALGALVKFFYSKLAEFHSQGAALDLGLQYKPPLKGLCIGLAVQNLGSQTAFISEVEPLPALVRGAFLQNFYFKEQCLSVSMEYIYSLVPEEVYSLATGLEYAYKDMFFIRGGYLPEAEDGKLTMGLGVQLKNFLRIDYAYVPYSLLGDTHRLQLTTYFGLSAK